MKLEIIEDAKMTIKKIRDDRSWGTCAMPSVIIHALYRLNDQKVHRHRQSLTCLQIGIVDLFS